MNYQQNYGYQQNNGYQQNGYPAQQAQQQTDGILGWDDEFDAEESNRNPLLPEGDYWFEIVKLERGRHNGSAKTPPCNKAIVTFKILSNHGTALLTENYFVIDFDWARQKNTSLFASIGIAKKGESRVKPVWSNEIAGRRGVCHIAPRTYTTQDGKEAKTNDMKYLYPQWDQPNVEPVAPGQQAAYQAPVQQAYGGQQQYAPQQYAQNAAQPQQNGYQSQQNGAYGGGMY